jgi:hypothetical protein
MSPTRRDLLRALGVGATAVVAGCLSNDGPADSPTTGPQTESPTDTPADGMPTDSTPTDGTGGTRPRGTGGPGVSIVAADESPELPVGPAVEVVTDAASEESPPQLRVTVTNEAEETLSIGEGRDVVFAYVADEDDLLILLPAGEQYPAEPDCWRLTEGIAVTEEYRTTELEPGESTSQLLDLYALPGEDACLPVGQFRFTATYSVARGTDRLPTDGESARWGFTITLE